MTSPEEARYVKRKFDDIRGCFAYRGGVASGTTGWHDGSHCQPRHKGYPRRCRGVMVHHVSRYPSMDHELKLTSQIVA